MKTFALVLLLALSTPIALAQAPGPPAAKKPNPQAEKLAAMFEQALNFQRAGKPDQAIATYKALIKLAPTAYPAYMNLGLLQSNRGDYAGAEASFRIAAKLEPESAPAKAQL